MMPRGSFPVTLAWAGGWLAVVAAGIALRPHLPVDETRYLAVAWEMWRDRGFLVPHLNGETYSHKPPLLFWLMHLGWGIFGVNDWTPRLVAPLFGLGTLVLTAALAARLWPEDARAVRLAPALLFGSAFFALFTTLTMFDLMLAFFAVLGLLGLAIAAEGRWGRGMAICGIALGLGVLAKGPAILLHVLPAALAAPWWAPNLAGARLPHWGRWYAGVFGAVLLGAAIGLAWAIPAAIAGGPEFARELFIGQSAGRMVESFAHKRPVWWYAAWLPVLLLPWTLWPLPWRAVRRAGSAAPIGGDGGIRLTLIWLAAAFVAFSFISGKQLHYLLPEFPALALFVARLASGSAAAPATSLGRFGAGAPALVLFAIAFIAGLLPILPGTGKLLARLAGVEFFWMALPALAALITAIFAWRRRPTAPETTVGTGAALMALLVVAVHLAAHPMLAQAHDLSATARRLKAWEDAGEAIAHVAKYHGQFHFAGRLEKPIAVIGLNDRDSGDWLAAHAQGKVVSYRDRLPAAGEPQPLSADPFRDGWVVVWDRDQLAQHPRSVYRD
ncbi:MAG: glycosyltransferase family 39 protein [Alphaproteobacteria bacterium]|nr:glycosyltransferase family 39 protein [Alphaproteobacteria bacterium]